MSNTNNILEMSYATQGNKTTLFTEKYISETLSQTQKICDSLEKLDGLKQHKLKVFTFSFDVFELFFQKDIEESLNQINSLLDTSKIKEFSGLSSYAESTKNLDVFLHTFKSSDGTKTGTIQYNTKLKHLNFKFALLAIHSAELLKILENIKQELKSLIVDSDIFKYDDTECFLTVNGVLGNDWSNPNGMYVVKPIVDRSFVIYKGTHKNLLSVFDDFGGSISVMHSNFK